MPDPTTDGLSTEERETIELVGTLVSTGKLHPLIALLQGGDRGPEHARDALRVLGELDLDMLVQLTLAHLIDEQGADPALAGRTRRAIHGTA